MRFSSLATAPLLGLLVFAANAPCANAADQERDLEPVPDRMLVGTWVGYPGPNFQEINGAIELVISANGSVTWSPLPYTRTRQWTGERWFGPVFTEPTCQGHWKDGQLVIKRMNAFVGLVGVPTDYTPVLKGNRITLRTKNEELSPAIVLRRFPMIAANRKRDLQPFLNALEKGDRLDRLWALHAIAQIGTAAGDAIPVLMKMLQSEDPGARHYSQFALAAIGEPAARALVPLLGDEKQYGTVSSILRRRMGPSSVPALLDELRNPKSKIRFQVLADLAFVDLDVLHEELGDNVDEAAKLLIAATKDDDRFIRERAIRPLSLIGVEPARLQQVLTAILQTHEDANTRKSAIFALYNSGVNDDGVAILTKALKDKDYLVRRTAAMILAKTGPAAKPAVMEMAALLSEESPWVRAPVARSLGDMGILAKDAAPLVQEALHRENALRAQRKHHESVLIALEYAAARVSGRSEKVVPRLMEVVTKSAGDRQWALKMLASIGSEAKQAVPTLAKQLNGDQAGYAAMALGAIGPGARSATEDLVTALKHENPYSAVRVAAALARIGSRPKLAMEELIRFLQHPITGVRLYAIETLQDLGPNAKDATAALTKARSDRSRRVRQAASSALRIIAK